MANRHFEPEPQPRADYPQDPDSINKHPHGTSGPVFFPNGVATDFKQFMWDLVWAYHLINQGLEFFKEARLRGVPELQAKVAYDSALYHYNNIFLLKWRTALEDPTTWVVVSLSCCCYITDARVITYFFAPHQPGQSSDQASVSPRPSSSSAYSPPP
jgi:hypothetical protein